MAWRLNLHLLAAKSAIIQVLMSISRQRYAES